MKWWEPTVFVTACITVAVFCDYAEAKLPRRTNREATREMIVNQTLDAVLEVGSDMRARGKHPTWQQLEREAAKKMNVRRTEWWMKRQ